jgi:hypothetical protein
MNKHIFQDHHTNKQFYQWINFDSIRYTIRRKHFTDNITDRICLLEY